MKWRDLMEMDKLGIERMGISLTIDVMKLDKSRFIAKQNGGKECDLTLWLSPNKKDKFDNHGGIQIALSKDERQAGKEAPYVGNARVFWAKAEILADEPAPVEDEPAPVEDDTGQKFDDDIPF